MAELRSVLQSIWSEAPGGKRGQALTPLLSLLSFPYGAAVGLRNRLYDRKALRQHRLPCRVVSIGNVTVGGTGKTPFAVFLAGVLKKKGFRPCVLSRGYGAARKSPVGIVSDGGRISARYPETGDEPLLIARSLSGIPVIAGADRVLTGGEALNRFGADVLVLDDAFQHRRLHRDIDIVLVDAVRPFGNGYLLPRGPLREPAVALRRADLIVRIGLAGQETPPDLIAALGGRPLEVFSGFREPMDLRCGADGSALPLEMLRKKRIAAFAGIASPEAFRKMLERLQARVVRFLAFPDHHPYRNEDIENIRREAAEAGAEAIVTTEKDGVRLEAFPGFLSELKQLRITITMSPSEEPFVEALLRRLHRETHDGR
jgi:tetraacyldisaccharide 4'-kinase